MDKFLQLLQEPFWWVSVVVVGLVLNLISSYLRDLIDKSTCKFLSKLRSIVMKDIDIVIKESIKTESDPIILSIIGSSIPSLQLDAVVYRIIGIIIAAIGYSHLHNGLPAFCFLIAGVLLFMWGSSKDALARKRNLMLTYILQRRMKAVQQPGER
ncbi:MAG: hypothetical protein FP814_11760 [Desulfobacterium sp.]|nr:hypothetical protein [Desulfobacteraceae bacterium]MBA3037155.1 hypothetical protein [Desulfobacterium sp.]MBU3947791.1 hypothetical protein [Pseudomonadota bacterium]MBU4034845.1 hypothetical protein [Pseudomonadota bacterium]